MGEIKSAREIAMDRAKKIHIPQARLEEARRKEYELVGQRLADRFISEVHFGLMDLEMALKKHGDEGRDIVRGAILARLLDAIGPGSYERALEGILAMSADKGTAKELNDKARALFAEYEREVRLMSRSLKGRLEESGVKRLEEMGISGSAIRINVESNREWLETLNEINSQYSEKLVKIKEEY